MDMLFADIRSQKVSRMLFSAPPIRTQPRLIPDAHPWVLVIVGAAVYLGAQVACVIVTATVSLADGSADVGGSLSMDRISGAALGAGLLMQALVALAGYVAISYGIRRRAPIELTRPGSVSMLLLGIVIGTVAMSVSVLILWLVGAYRVIEVGMTGQILAALLISVGASVSEELFFRGIVLHTLAVRFGAWPAMIVVSIVFGMIHSTNPGAGLWGGFAIVLSAGLLLNAAYLLTGNLWLPIGIHLAWNFVQSGIFGITVSGTTEQRGLFASEMVGPTWLTGGTMGIEGSVVLIAISLAAGLALAITGTATGAFRRERLCLEPARALR